MRTRLYADGTFLTASGNDLDSLLREINNNLPAVYEWLCSNKLTLNLTKLSFLFFNRNPLETNHLKKCLEKHFCAGTLLNTNETLSLL